MTRSAAEALCNAVVGFAVSWAVTWGLLGYTPVQSVAVTCLFFGLSFARSLAIREAFRRLA